MLKHIPMLVLAWLTISNRPNVPEGPVYYIPTPWGWSQKRVETQDTLAWKWWNEGERAAYLVWAAELMGIVKRLELPVYIEYPNHVRDWVDTWRKRWYGRDSG